MNNYTNPLNSLTIASPCSANWDEMHGDNRKRFCGECKLNVYNLSGMTRNEAEELLQNSEGRLCVRFYQRTDGTVLTEDCPVGWARIKQRVSKTAAAFASLIIGLVSGLGFTAAYNQPDSEIMVGKLEKPQSTPKPKATPKPVPSETPVIMGAVPVPENTPKPPPPKQMMGKIVSPKKP
jgi:hypothetical protein